MISFHKCISHSISQCSLYSENGKTSFHNFFLKKSFHIFSHHFISFHTSIHTYIHIISQFGVSESLLAFIASWQREMPLDPIFAPILKGATVHVGGLVDCKGRPVVPSRHRPAGGSFLLRCGMLYRRGQSEADRLCVPEGGHLRRDILRECHDTPLGGHFGPIFGRHNTAMLVRRLTFWPCPRGDVDSSVRSCDTC